MRRTLRPAGPGAWSASPLPVGQLYDARRRVYYAKPVLRGWLHVLWFGASLVAGPLLVPAGTGPGRSPRSPSTRSA
jgi:hypothetical protein